MTLLDVHVLNLPGLPQKWIDQRRQSIASALKHAGYLVQLHEVFGLQGHLGKSRALGYSQGSARYVTHVDHDDLLRKDAFQVLLPYLLEDAEAITTGELLLFENGKTQEAKNSKHHLAVYRRDLLSQIDYARFVHYPDQYLLQKFRPVHIPECVYTHRIWGASLSRKHRKLDAQKAEAELKEIKHAELCRIELMSFAEIAKEIDKELCDAEPS